MSDRLLACAVVLLIAPCFLVLAFWAYWRMVKAGDGGGA